MDAIEDLKGRTAIVTGAGQGMGRAVAEALAKRGARAVVNDLKLEVAEKSRLATTGHRYGRHRHRRQRRGRTRREAHGRADG